MADDSRTTKLNFRALLVGALSVVAAALVTPSASADPAEQNGASAAPFPAMTAAQAKDLVAGLKDKARFESNGMIVGHERFTFARATSDVCAIGKKADTSLLVCLTGKTLLVALAKEGGNPMRVTRVELAQN